MNTRATLVVGLSALILFAGVGMVAGIGSVADDSDAADDRAVAKTNDHIDEETSYRETELIAQYKVSLNNVTIETWLLRNATVVNATVDEVVIRNATTNNGSQTNVTLTNAEVREFVLERGRLRNVTAKRLVVRNKSLLNIPGGGFIDPNVENRTIERHWTKNQTVSGVVIDKISIDAAFLCENTTLGAKADEDMTVSPQTGDEKPDIVLENGTVSEALVIRGEASDWSVGSVQQSDATNASLPDGCSRG